MAEAKKKPTSCSTNNSRNASNRTTSTNLDGDGTEPAMQREVEVTTIQVESKTTRYPPSTSNGSARVGGSNASDRSTSLEPDGGAADHPAQSEAASNQVNYQCM